jgi:hypothetical protein
MQRDVSVFGDEPDTEERLGKFDRKGFFLIRTERMLFAIDIGTQDTLQRLV